MLTELQKEHVARVEPETRAEMARVLEEASEVVIISQDEVGEAPPFAIALQSDHSFWVDCCGTARVADERARALGLRVVHLGGSRNGN
ncbi:MULTISPECIES: hypothetical protein [Achromobacter]|uniref:hypothetical protein n=1 Tax=Achromobacter TaxID=222 RepID=UPI0023F85BC0|nr:hypothetical protein [Achromobacter anxifer]MDF8365092.1 hypothetical protein [Achromobacter anxifer]